MYKRNDVTVRNIDMCRIALVRIGKICDKKNAFSII